VAPISRIVCDVERFEFGEDMEESFGMGIVYERGHLQNILRAVTPELKKEIVQRYYQPHHRALYDVVTEELSKSEIAVIVDCHSFNDEQLPHVTNTMRPDFCIGSDSFHTPPELVEQLVKYLNDCGYCTVVNEPFAGTIVPLDYYHVNPNIVSVMIEVNKRLYLDEQIEKNRDFKKIKSHIATMLKIINDFTN
jgi:N-formylglutamate amidohydrolase